MSRTRKRHGTFSSIVGKCASIRQIESVSQSMFSEEDHHKTKIFGLRRKIQLIFFFIYFFTSYNGTENGWLKHWQRNQSESENSSAFNIISTDGFFIGKKICFISLFLSAEFKAKKVLFFSYKFFQVITNEKKETKKSGFNYLNLLFLSLCLRANWIISSSKL